MKKLSLILSICLLSLAFAALPNVGAQMIGMENPWVETDENGFIRELGLSMDVPEGAEDVIYRMLPETGLGEIQFTLYGMHFNARIKATAFFEDISGMFHHWEQVDLVEIKNRQGVVLQAKDGEDTVELCTWVDIVPGISYAVSVKAADLDGFDITAVADAVFKPMQGDAG